VYSFVFLSFVCVMCNNAVLVLGLASKAGIAQKKFLEGVYRAPKLLDGFEKGARDKVDRICRKGKKRVRQWEGKGPTLVCSCPFGCQLKPAMTD